MPFSNITKRAKKKIAYNNLRITIFGSSYHILPFYHTLILIDCINISRDFRLLFFIFQTSSEYILQFFSLIPLKKKRRTMSIEYSLIVVVVSLMISRQSDTRTNRAFFHTLKSNAKKHSF